MRRRTFVGGAVAAVGLLGTGALVTAAVAPGGAAGAATDSPTTTTPAAQKTAKVTTRDLVQTEQVDGRLGYGADADDRRRPDRRRSPPCPPKGR